MSQEDDDYIETLERRLAECQAREKVLRDYVHGALLIPHNGGAMFCLTPKEYQRIVDVPSDATALDTMLKQAKREALLEAIRVWEISPDTLLMTLIRRMAEELK